MLRNDNPSDDELLRYAGTVLQLRTDTDPHAATELAELASFHDELRPTQQNFLAAHFLDVLHNQLRLDSLDEVGVNILSLTDPYFVRSDHRAAAELLISSAFAEAEWHRRSFEDLVVIGSALAELAYSASGAKDLWRRFYQRFAGDSEKADDALDVALAGLSGINVEAFADIIAARPFDDHLAKCWEIYLSLLIKKNKLDAVQSALTRFIASAPDPNAASVRSLKALATSKGMRLVADVPRARDGANFRIVAGSSNDVPVELALAHGYFIVERDYWDRFDKKRLQHSDPTIHVIHSDYIDHELIGKYQAELKELIRAMAEPGRVLYHGTENFSELPVDSTLPQRLIYTFPTYLTQNKFSNGYSVFELGRQRRLGALYFENSILFPVSGETTLAGLLLELSVNTGSRLYCLQNYAMSELVNQTLASRPEVAAEFKKHSSLRTVRLPDEHNSDKRKIYVPAEVGRDHARSTVFLFDLAGRDEVMAQIKASKTANKTLKGATVIEIEHDLDIPVGIGLNRYAAAWAYEDKRWLKFREFAARWADNEAFCGVMKTLGIDINKRAEYKPQLVVPASTQKK